MKILWTVNLIPSEASQKLRIDGVVLGGWVEAMAARLREYPGVQLCIACKTDPAKSFDEVINGVRYISLGYSGKTTSEQLESACADIIGKFSPDLVQIEGTEFAHARAMINAAKTAGIPAVVSLQGILNGQYKYQCGQLEIDDMMFSASFKKIYTAWILHLRKTRWFKPRMKTEREIIESADYLIGRTTWDRAHSYKINPKARYFTCNRVLRQPFYEHNWDIDKMEKHSLYVGNGYYALKGVQYVIEALPELAREYPDVKVYVAGVKPFDKNDKRPFYKRGYGLYLEKLIKDLGVEKHIEFTGPLSADKVAERLSRVNAYVLCSAIENSPNTLGEAMRIGTPCVSSYVGGAPDMAVDGQEALFFRNDDPALLAWQIKRVFDNAELAQRLSANAKRKAEITHDPKLNSKALYNIYQEILAD